MVSLGELVPITKAVEDTAKPLGEAVGTTLADVWQGIIGDRVTAWRLRNAASLSVKLEAEIAKTGRALNLDKIPEGIAFSWFEKATQTDEPEIQELFAKLLSNAAEGNEAALRKRNIELVSSLSPDDAKLLAYVAERYTEFQQTKAAKYQSFALNYAGFFFADYTRAGFKDGLPIETLVSLGVLRLQRDFKHEARDIGRVISLAMSEHVRGADIGLDHMFETEDKLILTELGESLIEALFLPGGSVAAP